VPFSGKIAAHRIGKTAFFDPSIRTLPLSLLLFLTINLSINASFLQRVVANLVP
jgi:hypothetical protein